MSRIEKQLQKINGDDVEMEEPQSRIEKQLAYILGADIVLEEPQSRIEELVQQIIDNGGGGGGGGGGDFSSATLTITDRRDPTTVSMVNYTICACLETDEWDDDYPAGTYVLTTGIQQGDSPQTWRIALYKGKSLIIFETARQQNSIVTGSYEWMNNAELMISGDCSIELITN